MSAIILVVLTLLEEIAGLTTSTSEIGKILQALINIVPTLEAEFQSLVAPVQNIIAALGANPATTAAQLAVVQALDAQDDAAFEAAITSYNAANPTAPLTVTPVVPVAPAPPAVA